MTYSLKALNVLHDAGAQLALLRAKTKVPARKGHAQHWPTKAEVERHVARGGAIGVRPETLGCVVFDCDDGDGPVVVESWAEEAHALTTPSSSTATKPHKGHAWIRAEKADAIKNWQFEIEHFLDGVASGDLRTTIHVCLTPEAAELLADNIASLLDGPRIDVQKIRSEARRSKAEVVDADFDKSAGVDLTDEKIPAEVLKRLSNQPEDRSSALHRVAGALKAQGFSFESVLFVIEPFVCQWVGERDGLPVMDRKYEGASLEHHLSLSWAKLDPPRSAADDFEDDLPTDLVEELPEILQAPGLLAQNVRDAQDALLLSFGETLLQRQGELVRPLIADQLESSDGLRHHEGSVRIVPVNEAWLRLALSDAAKWYTTAKTGRRRADPKMEIARSIANNSGAWPFHVLKALVSSPTVDIKTGSVVDKPGIDSLTGLLGVFDADQFPKPRNDLTADEASHVMAGITHDLLRGFPFVDEASKSVAVSAMMSAAARPTMTSCPMHVFDSPTPGTGKSMLANIIGVLATGAEPSAATWSSDEVENEKRLGAILRDSPPVVLFDNLDANKGDAIGGTQFCIMLTSERIEMRILGKTERQIVGTRVLFLATGNNIEVKGDACRRVVKCRIDAKCEAPEERTFDFNALDIAKKRRGEMVSNLCSILASYIAAGRPCDPKGLGSFQDWTAIRGALVWCGLEDPASTIAEVKAADESRSLKLASMSAWHDAFDSDWVTAEAALDWVDQPDDLASSELPHGVELSDAKEALKSELLGDASTKQWASRSLKQRDGEAVGPYRMESMRRGRILEFRVTNQDAA